MRPLRLDVEGFTCYRERQQPLDFSSMSLFAIAGPTGAGKSSVLDTMLYALYGVVPRVGKQAIGEFISHGRDSMSVCLDFRVSGRDYRVTRRVKRPSKGPLKTTATLAELVGGVEKGLADNVKPVNEAVAAVLGLGYDEFIQTVVLPQGDFAKFLKAQPIDQRAILQHLLRHDVFMRMRDEAERRRKLAAGQVDVIEGKLTTYEGATPEALAALEASLAVARAELDAAGAARDAADASLADVQARHLLTQQMAELRTRLATLDQQAPQVEDAREQLERARRATPVAPLVEAARLASAAKEAAARTRTEMVRVVDHAATARSKAASAAEAAGLAAREGPEVERRIQALDEIAGDLTQRAQLADALLALPPRLTAADREVETARAAAAAARHSVVQAQARQQSLADERDATAFDEALHAQMERIFPSVVEARAIHAEVLALVDEVERATRAHATAQRADADAHAAEDTARQVLTRAAEDADAARTALDEGRVTHAAAAIRAHLHEGDACPVCLQMVESLPAVPVTAALAALEQAARVAIEREKAAERAHQQTVTAAAQATAVVSAAAETLASVSAKHQIRDVARAALVATIAAAVPEAIGAATRRSRPARTGTALADSGAAVLDQVEQRLGDLRRAKIERDRRTAALQTAAAALAEATLALAHAESAARVVEASGEQLRTEQTRLQHQLDDVIARIRGVTTADDPKAERAALARQLVDWRDAERRAREALTAADLAVTAATERLRAADDVSSNCEVALISSRAQLAAALAAATFVDADEVAQALRTPAAQAALQKTVSAHDEQRALVGHQLAALEPKVTGREVSAGALAAAAGHRAEAQTRWQLVNQQVATLQSEEGRLRKDLAARLALAGEREALAATLAITSEMATDLKSDGFQDYLLEEAFLSLVSGASVRMREISNRYTLDWCDSEFHVVDHDNAGERRRADTLSGGETFMASLCLALQLSETVLQASGALQMDSLFVDEGFGTLDSDALAEVTDAIERLGRDGQRMVGVISHREELTDRLPGLIRIEKGMGESTWRVERVG